MTITATVDSDGIAVVTMHHPPVNSLTVGDTWQIGDEFEKLSHRDDVRCIILTAEGKGFNAGIDIKEMQSRPGFEFFLSSGAACYSTFEKIYMSLVPTIAAVNDFCMGLGVGLVGSCDMIVASEAAEWRLPQAGLGIIPAQGGTIRLARWVGKGQAMRAALGFPLHADEAFRIGLAQWLVPPASLMDKAMEVANHIAALPPLAARLTKESLRSGLEQPLPEAVLGDLYRFAMLEMTEDKAESHRSWRERRKPDFKGR